MIFSRPASRYAVFVLAAMACLAFAGWGEVRGERGAKKKEAKEPAPPPKGKGGGEDGPGKGFKLPSLTLTDVSASDEQGVYGLLPADGQPPVLGISETAAWRLAAYSESAHALRFVVLDLATLESATVDVPLPRKVKPLAEMPRACTGGGGMAVVWLQAQVLFVDPVAKTVEVASDLDSSQPVIQEKPKRERPNPKGGKPTPRGSSKEYRVHGGADGRSALSVLRNYDAKTKTCRGSDATLYRPGKKALTLKWEHEKYGLPPRDKDAVFAATEAEIALLTVLPRVPGEFTDKAAAWRLVFDASSGALREAQEVPGDWAGSEMDTFSMSPDGGFLVLRPYDRFNRQVLQQGSWESVYETDYFDACVGFSPDGKQGVFLANKDSERAFLLALDLGSRKELWRTTVTHVQATRNEDTQPFGSVAPKASALACTFGVLKGVSADEPEFLYAEEGATIHPLCAAWDGAGKQIGVLTNEALLVLDGKSREEIGRISLASPLDKTSQGGFLAFDDKGEKAMAHVLGRGIWRFDLKTLQVDASIPAPRGAWVRPLPDLSGVVYSEPTEDGGKLMRQPMDGGDSTVLYRPKYLESQAVCLWIDPKKDLFLVDERGASVPCVRLVDDKGEVVSEYDVPVPDQRLSGAVAVAAMVTSKKKLVLIREISAGKWTAMGCAVIKPGEGAGAEADLYFTVDQEAVSSNEGGTGVAPLFGAVGLGDEKECSFATPSGVLRIDIKKAEYQAFLFSRSPRGAVALHPKGKEFFVAGRSGFALYDLK